MIARECGKRQDQNTFNVLFTTSMHMMADTSTLKPIQRVKPIEISAAKRATVG
jgi:hypothetical protein